jgi:outer membrane receptor protein involved in Fe transport
LYYQQLFNVPVSIYDSSSLSTLNILNDYVVESMENGGKGKNYGVEISLERYLKDNFYLTLSNSFYQSKYTAKDGVERNTRFNGNYLVTLITGKEFISERKSKTFGINLKTIYAGGLRTTPIDFDASQLQGYTVFKGKSSLHFAKCCLLPGRHRDQYEMEPETFYQHFITGYTECHQSPECIWSMV